MVTVQQALGAKRLMCRQAFGRPLPVATVVERLPSSSPIRFTGLTRMIPCTIHLDIPLFNEERPTPGTHLERIRGREAVGQYDWAAPLGLAQRALRASGPPTLLLWSPALVVVYIVSLVAPPEYLLAGSMSNSMPSQGAHKKNDMVSLPQVASHAFIWCPTLP